MCSVFLLCLPNQERPCGVRVVSWCLIQADGMGMFRDQATRVAQASLGLVNPFGGVECRCHAQYTAFSPNALFFAPSSSEVTVEDFFHSFCILLSRICPNCACTPLFLVLYSFFVFVAQGDICPGTSCSKGFQAPGPSLSQSQDIDFITRKSC